MGLGPALPPQKYHPDIFVELPFGEPFVGFVVFFVALVFLVN